MTAQSKTFPLVFTLILKYILEYVPVKILGRLTLFIRDLLRSALSADKNTRLPVIISSPCAEYDALSYRTSEVIEDAPAERANDIIFYLHGGGFAIHDNTDIILSPTLFPVLNELLGYRPPEIYSVRYTISPVKGEPHTFTRIQKEVYDAFKSIASQGKNIVAIIGDSAGGNLALGLVLRLLDESYPRIPALCLISPWLHLYADDNTDPSTNRDYITPLSERHFREIYLGMSLAQKLESVFHAGSKAGEENRWDGLNRTQINEYLDAASNGIFLQDSLTTTIDIICPALVSDDIVSKLPPTFLVAGENEIFFKEINIFGRRLLQNNGSDTKHQYVIGKDELHVYLCFTTRVIYLICLMLNIEWLFNWVYAGSTITKIQLNYALKDNNGEEMGQRMTKAIAVHSEEAFVGLKALAKFVARAVQISHTSAVKSKN